MAESIREVLARMKSQQPAISQPTKPIEKKKVEEEEIIGEEDLEEEEEKKTPVKEETKKEIKEEKPIESQEEVLARQRAMELEMLQNNGRFRAELLFQLQEINKNLIGLAEVIATRNK